MIQEDIDTFIRFFKLYIIHGELIWIIKVKKEVTKLFEGVMHRLPHNNNELQSFQSEAEDLGYAIKKNELENMETLLLVSKLETCRCCFKKLEQKRKKVKEQFIQRKEQSTVFSLANFAGNATFLNTVAIIQKTGVRL